ncbi:acetyl-CoA acetyltransferase [Alphaproteobacteria bacterium]
MTEQIAIVSALRTAIGSFNGTLSALPAYKLGSAIIKKILANTKVAAEELDQVIMGQVLSGAMGQNPARQASIDAGVPQEVPAWVVNQVCGSGLKSVMSAYQYLVSYNTLYNDNSRVLVAGGQESMSSTPHAIYLRNGIKMGDAKLIDMMVYDGLTDVFGNVHMGITAENIASKYNISRVEQDEFAAISQNKAEAAQNSGQFTDEIIPITINIPKQDSISFIKDEFVRYGVTKESLGKLKPAFMQNGTVTAGNSSGINDGAAAVMLMTLSEAKRRNLEPLAIIRSCAQAGVDPSIMGTGPVPASRKALQLANWNVQDLDLIEANEAFAVQSIYVNKEMGWDVKKINVNGGAIALGHPIGASGTRILVTLLHGLRKRGGGRGLATLCIGGGMGIAMCLQTP